MNVLMIFLIIPQFVFSFNGKCAGKVRQNTILGELHKITSPKSSHIVQYCTFLYSGREKLTFKCRAFETKFSRKR